MKKVLFESIIEITNQRDSDSLPRALLFSLAKIFPLKEACIYKNIATSAVVTLKQILKLTSTGNWADNNAIKFINDEIDIKNDSAIAECIEKSDFIINEDNKGTTSLLIPIYIEQKLNSILHIKANSGITKIIDDIANIIKVYINHLTILNESERDKLTGLFNRRTFDNKLNNLLLEQKNKSQQRQLKNNMSEKRAYIPGGSAWLAMIDIDFFKHVNDEYGHVAGDEVLLRLSQKMQECFRNSDLLFRFGGEEFVVVLEPISQAMVQAKLDRFRNIIENYQFPYIGKITISMGYAMITENDFPTTILDYADKALYYAKQNGRNRVYNYENLLESGELEGGIEAGSVDLF